MDYVKCCYGGIIVWAVWLAIGLAMLVWAVRNAPEMD